MHSAYLPFVPIRAQTPHSQTEITFNRYRNIDFLDQIWVQGEKHGMQLLPGTASQEAVKHETEKYRHALPGLLRK